MIEFQKMRLLVRVDTAINESQDVYRCINEGRW